MTAGRHLIPAVVNPLDRGIIRLGTTGHPHIRSLLIEIYNSTDDSRGSPFDELSSGLSGAWGFVAVAISLGLLLLDRTLGGWAWTTAAIFLFAVPLTLSVYHGVIRELWRSAFRASTLSDCSLVATFIVVTSASVAIWA